MRSWALNQTLGSCALVLVGAVLLISGVILLTAGSKYATAALIFIMLASFIAMMMGWRHEGQSVAANAVTAVAVVGLYTTGVLLGGIIVFRDLPPALFDWILVLTFGVMTGFAVYVCIEGWARAQAKTLPNGWQTRLVELWAAGKEVT